MVKDGLSGAKKALAAELAGAAAVAAMVKFGGGGAAGAGLFLSIILVFATTGTLVVLLKRLTERGAARFDSQAARALCWGIFLVIGIPLSLGIAFLACCAPAMSGL